MSEFKHYPWSTDYKKIWEYIQNKIESEHNEHPYGTHGLGLIFVYNDKILSDISWLYSQYEPFDSKPLSLFIGFDPVCESLCDISEYEEFEAWAKSINLRFLDHEEIIRVPYYTFSDGTTRAIPKELVKFKPFDPNGGES
ncbi:MAG TPA: hypothetical protein DCR71_00595 [Dehalococcoidia bacterium]|jgi:hypothetical protein|nr:hypothetical protein [Dehalococcoidia bacterium]